MNCNLSYFAVYLTTANTPYLRPYLRPGISVSVVLLSVYSSQESNCCWPRDWSTEAWIGQLQGIKMDVNDKCSCVW